VTSVNSGTARRDVLLHHPFFVDLDSDKIDQLLGYSRVQRYRAKQGIFAEGSTAQSLYGVLSGRVRISGSSPEGATVTYNIIVPGQVFGEIALLDGKPRSADAIAMTDCELLVLDRREFMKFLHSEPRLVERLLVTLCDRLRRTTKQVGDLLFIEGASRVARTLLELAALGKTDAGDAAVTIRITQQELSHMLGLSRETINKQLAAWQRAGLVKAGKGVIKILSIRGLRDRAADTDP
jgi:CRP-like cAMP-binding protein